MRIVRALFQPEPAVPQVVGVDDWAMRRGHHCGTSIVGPNVKTMKCPSTTATLRWPRAGEGVFIEYLLRLADARRYEYVITLRAVETIEQERPEFVKYCKNKSGGFY